MLDISFFESRGGFVICYHFQIAFDSVQLYRPCDCADAMVMPPGHKTLLSVTLLASSCIQHAASDPRIH